MEYINRLWVGLLTLAILIGCEPTNNKNETENPAELKEQEVMEIHDIAMAKMEIIYNYEVKLKAKLADQGPDSTKINQYLEDLSIAHESMMNWMRNYKKPDGTRPQQEVITYLEKEKIKIEEVNTFTHKAIAQAEAFISSH
ncbi:hypothetical protein [Flexithrix dorotheae]|uniref:hypothetical protein n=1 Tax=Flexithrix dorotheae TaxID=70993 RepID=UPI0003604712|nr:hypothetical protein [Flexithrix dorotheae]